MLTNRTFSQRAYPPDPSQSNRGYDPDQIKTTDDKNVFVCHHESVRTPDGYGAFCRFCGETLE